MVDLPRGQTAAPDDGREASSDESESEETSESEQPSDEEDEAEKPEEEEEEEEKPDEEEEEDDKPDEEEEEDDKPDEEEEEDDKPEEEEEEDDKPEEEEEEEGKPEEEEEEEKDKKAVASWEGCSAADKLSWGLTAVVEQRCPTCNEKVPHQFARHARRCYKCDLCKRFFQFPSHRDNCAQQMAQDEENRSKKGYSECPICSRVIKNMATHIRKVHQQDPSLFSGRKSRIGDKEERAKSAKLQSAYGRKVRDVIF
jgi:hypothetical protein